MKKQSAKKSVPRRTLILFYSLVALFILISINCAPYSLPDKKSYSEKDDPYLHYSESLEAYDAQDYDLALQKINQALLINNNMALFYQHQGNIYRRLADYDKALESYKTAIQKRSNFIDVHETIGDIYQEQRDYNEAVRYYKKAIALEPRRIDITLKLARCYLNWGEYEVVQYHLNNYKKSAGEFNIPLTDQYFLLRGEVLFKMKKYDESITYLAKTEQSSVKSLQLFGENYYALNDYEKGVLYFNKLLKLQKDEGEWYLYRGIYFFKKKDYNDARSQLEYALKLDQNLIEVHYYLGKIFVEEKNTSEALREFQIYRQQMRDDDKLNEVNALIKDLENLK